MSDQTVLIDQFLSSVIGTIHPDEIFDSIIDTAASLLSPDGLLLTIRDDVSPSYHVTRSFGDITWEKDSFLDSSILFRAAVKRRQLHSVYAGRRSADRA